MARRMASRRSNEKDFCSCETARLPPEAELVEMEDDERMVFMMRDWDWDFDFDFVGVRPSSGFVGVPVALVVDDCACFFRLGVLFKRRIFLLMWLDDDERREKRRMSCFGGVVLAR